MFERFTERARQAVVLAQDEARELRHNYIGTEHLLLGLLRVQEGLAARALVSVGVTADAVRARVKTVVGEGDVEPVGKIPFTPEAKKTLEIALRESMKLGHRYIGTEHILLGLARELPGVGGELIASVGDERIRQAVYQELGPHQAVARAAQGGTVHSFAPAFWRRHGPPPWPRQEGVERGRRFAQVELVVAGWALFALALGAGILVGWGIWH